MARRRQQPVEELQLWQTATPVEFAPLIPDKSEAQALLISTRQGAGFPIAAGQLGHAINSRATHLLLDYTQAACAIRYQIDGAWEELPPLDREASDAMLYAIKQLCLMNPADRRSPQTGNCDLKAGREKFRFAVQSKGTPSGERVLAKLEPEKLPFERLEDLGMRDKMIVSLKERLNAHGNLVLITAPKSEGLTTTWTVTLNSADRFVRDFQSFENADQPEPEIINVNPNLFGGDTGSSELEVLNRAVLKEPEVLIFPELPSAEAMAIALEQIGKTDKQVYVRMVAPNAMQGLVQLVSRYKQHSADIAKYVGAVLGQKLVRRLCDQCKAGFEPPPQLLQKLGIPAGRVAMLYQPFVPPPIEQQVDENGKPAPIEPCQVCNGRGYHGRIGVFELLTPGEKLRTALTKTSDIAQLNAIAKSEGYRGLQTEAVLTVARGLTSLDELKRMFAKK